MSVSELPVVELAETAVVDLRELNEALTSAISTHHVRCDRLTRALYATDASVYQIIPLLAAFPATTADVQAIVAICSRFRVPITPRGGGTSQAGQSIGPGVIVDCSKHFDRVLEINPEEHWARVEPGCVLDELNRELQPYRLLFAPDVSTSNRATIGGMIANNSSGARSVLYGKTIDHVIELKTVLADGRLVHLEPLSDAELEARCSQANLEGRCYQTVYRLARDHAQEIDRRFPKILRRVGGYNLDEFVPGHARGQGDADRRFNLTRMFVGSEGTLGVTVEAKLKLVELPRARGMLVVQFADLLEALAATPLILEHGPSAVEVVDNYVLDSTRLNPEASRLRDFLEGDPVAVLLIEFYGDRVDDLAPRVAALRDELVQKGTGYHHLVITDAAAQARVWKLRTMALGLSMAEKGDAKAISFVEDTAVAPENLRDYIAEFLTLIARHQTEAGVYAHASVGCLHVRPVINLKTEEGVRKFEAIAGEVADLVLKYGGALSGEHGDGLVRSPFQEKMYGPVLYQAFRELKRAFDPSNLLNPGKIVDAPPLVQNLRYGPVYVTPAISTTFDFSADGGLLPAAELCAGVGACRKKRDGMMCPSFQATRDEKDSTRGRANLLRLAITGQLGLEGFTDPQVHKVLDLCLECKACKSECPTNVDMARLKAEFLHQFHRKYGLPWRNRFFGHVAKLGRAGSSIAPLSNWLVRSRLARRLNEKLLGIDHRRMPPAFARRSLIQRFPTMARASATSQPDRQVLLFPDTFTNYFEPEIGEATIDLLGRFGCSVTLGQPGLRCCGRPLISNGLLDQAVVNARHNVERLFEWSRAGRPIIACEPSCILTIRDDYPALLRGELRSQADVVANTCRTFEEYFESIVTNPASQQLYMKAGPRRILVQAHCHQQSLVGVGSVLRALQVIPGSTVINLDAGCCGMAGSFGYEVEHYDVSRLVGEARLFPALREAGPDDVIVAPGFSCRLQIRHFTGREAVHPAELLQSQLVSRRAPMSGR
ncbi:MAG TPA: FAD-linked oxidase C-terminal domain-containing protein [Isosphaeraceae bacterium]|nr:FAD-linked oxidase C-terminal domain-containing protein [Isosphaeraceae bacterium]